MAALLGLVALPSHGVARARTQEICPGADVGPGGQDVGRADRAVLCLVNQRRAEAGLPALRADGPLGAAATRHSQDMVSRRYFGHDDRSGASPVDRARRAGYCRRICTIAENIAWASGSQATPAAIVARWMSSAPHRAAILDGRLRMTGIGVELGAPAPVRGGAATVTEDFGG